MSDVEVVERLNTITRLQASIIDELFLLLMQHITVDEADKLAVVDRINEAARLKADIDRR